MFESSIPSYSIFSLLLFRLLYWQLYLLVHSRTLRCLGFENLSRIKLSNPLSILTVSWYAFWLCASVPSILWHQRVLECTTKERFEMVPCSQLQYNEPYNTHCKISLKRLPKVKEMIKSKLMVKCDRWLISSFIYCVLEWF